MNKYRMEITLNSPVCIAQKRGIGNVIETLDYIPGSTIRGALAMLYLQKKGEYNDNEKIWELKEKKQKEQFNAVFNSDNARFGNCYPEEAKVIPYTATSCKYFSGFRKDPHDPAETHCVFDTLIPLAEHELIGKKQSSGKIEEKFENCQSKMDEQPCGAIMDRFSGYYKQTDSTLFERINLSKRLIARTAIMDSLGTAFPGRLYTIEALNEKDEKGVRQKFSGCLETDETTFKTLKEILENNTLRIGSAKSRALGEISLQLGTPSPLDERWLIREVAERLKDMNSNMQKYVSQRYSQGQTDANTDIQNFKSRYFFSVTLHSDAILRDEILRFKSALEIQDLIDSQPNLTPQQQNLLKKFQILRAWLSAHVVSGWNTALKLPKEDEVAISKGSVFLFVTKPCETFADTEVQPLADILKQVEESGIGERKNEGFGNIRICDEFHWKVHIK